MGSKSERDYAIRHKQIINKLLDMVQYGGYGLVSVARLATELGMDQRTVKAHLEIAEIDKAGVFVSHEKKEFCTKEGLVLLADKLGLQATTPDDTDNNYKLLEKELTNKREVNMAKPKVAMYWCASCGGCEEAVVDLNEDILKVVEAVDIVLWPVALDFKRKDIEAMADGEIAVSFINGSIRLEEQEEMVKLLREKSGLVVAFGSCAHLGGIPGLANFWSRKTVFERAYLGTESTVNPAKKMPQEQVVVDGYELKLPEFFDTVKALDQVIPVDYYLPGCPPVPDLIMNAVNAILTGQLPEKGAVLAPNIALCDTCPRKESKPDKLSIKEFKRPWEIKIDPEQCFLVQGLFCYGPATRSGCGETCINANQGCRGCFGPVDGVVDQGAKALSMMASMLGLEDEEKMSEEETKKLIDTIADPAGTFYRFSLPTSLLKRKRISAIGG
jgi:F420-non-reducing hydrogenase small subunit